MERFLSGSEREVFLRRALAEGGGFVTGSKQLEKAVKIFDEMNQKHLLPIHEIDKDPARKELDNRFAREVLGLPDSVLAPGGALDVLRMKLAQEPSIRGNK